MRDAFPLANAEAETLLADLQRRVGGIKAGERAAVRALRAAAAAGRKGGV